MPKPFGKIPQSTFLFKLQQRAPAVQSVTSPAVTRPAVTQPAVARPTVTRPSVTLLPSTIDCNSPQGLNVALLGPLHQRSDALDRVGAVTIFVDTTELVAVQTVVGSVPLVRLCQNPMPHCANTADRSPYRDKRLALLDPLGERNDALGGVCASAILVNAAEHVLVQTA